MKYAIVATLVVLSFQHQALAIIAGQNVDSSSSIAASTAAFIEDETPNAEYPGGIERDACSGTLLADDILVTAGHCVREVGNAVGLKIYFALDVYQANPAIRVIDAAVINPDFKGYSWDGPTPKNNSDIALLHFTGGLPAGYRAAEVLASDYKPTGNEAVTLAGYGNFSPVKVDADNNVIDPLAPLGAGVLRETQASFLVPAYAATELQFKESDQSYAASGDSGGPAYVAVSGKLYFVGVDNWGDKTALGRFEVYADVRAHMPWNTNAITALRKKH